ncbi:MAG: molybdopterin-binding protein, partial [Planktomarina sp.]|nr:molybdopterin-binding protein [Planktomarina sp.]
GAISSGPQSYQLLDGRAAAGEAFVGSVSAGEALRVLTGAALPAGAQTVVLQEDVLIQDGIIEVNGPLELGSNVRATGEDITAGTVLLQVGHKLTPQDLGMLVAVGVSKVEVFKPLRVVVISTGTELRAPGSEAQAEQIYDANSPMLSAILRRWNLHVIEFGIVQDDPEALRKALDRAAECADVIITSGGASAGDEDHLSAILNTTGTMALWRVAVKPGRPLALGVWNGAAIFGLPGNPVAAFVCLLIFARPALSQLAGAGFTRPEPLMLPAAFNKKKKPGRREYLRARLRSGRVDIFTSEGSGRISGLSWSDGLVELTEDETSVIQGQLVRYLPYSSFGL